MGLNILFTFRTAYAMGLSYNLRDENRKAIFNLKHLNVFFFQSFHSQPALWKSINMYLYIMYDGIHAVAAVYPGCILNVVASNKCHPPKILFFHFVCALCGFRKKFIKINKYCRLSIVDIDEFFVHNIWPAISRIHGMYSNKFFFMESHSISGIR